MTWKDSYQEWIQFSNLDPELRQQMEGASEESLEDAFGGQLSFGTAGMRGLLGPGPNRMNIYTVRQATEGLSQLILAAGPEAKNRGVAIAYDSRHMSPDFAMESARILAHHGVKAYVYESLRPTPVLSFAVRHLGAYAGIMITASHNPAAYNGYKVYGEDGGQMPPEDADRLTRFVRAVQDPLSLQVAEADHPLIEIIGDSVDQAYLEAMKTVTIDSDLIQEMAEDISIVFTPLHGTGLYLGLKALKQAGFKEVHVVEAQAQEDGNFPTVVSPNPESPESFVLAEKLGHQVQADILLATDPDADRLGAMIRRSDDSYQLLTGNQIASLMLDYILKALKDQDQLPENGVAVKSIVSTELADQIVDRYDLEMVEVLTGFKFIAEKIQEYEETGAHTFLMGFEESYGYLIKPFVRDKDAIQALVMLAELTAYHKKKGETLGNALEEIYETYGYYVERTISVDYPGLSGQEKMKAIMASIRKADTQEIAGIPVVQSADYLQSIQRDADGQESPLDYPKSDALKYWLDDGSWVAFRPSGTEPKIKLYLGAQGHTQDYADRRADELEAGVRQMTE